MARRGADDTSRRELIRRLADEYYTRLLQYANVLTGGSPDAADITQETFLTALARAEELEKHPNAYGWLRKALYNHVRHWRTRQQRELERRALPRETEEGTEDPLELAADPEDRTERAILSIDLDRMLTEEEYRLIRMVYFEGTSTEEAAQTLGVKAAACRKRIQRIRDKLRERYTE